MSPQHWVLHLYVAGRALGLSRQAETNLRKLCDLHLQGRYRIQVIDLAEEPALAREHQVTAVPMVVRIEPPPYRKIVGSMSNEASALLQMGFRVAQGG